MIGLIILTIMVYLAGFYYSSFIGIWGLVYIGLSIGSVLLWLVLFIYSDSKNKLPWLFIITLFPVIGVILYLMIGHHFRETFRYHRRLKELGEGYIIPCHQYENQENQIRMSQLSKQLIHLNKMVCKSDVSFKSKTQILTNGDQKFPILLDILKRAERFIFIEYYIFNSDEIGLEVIKVLKERAQAGVEVKLLFDSLGSSRRIKHEIVEEMREIGISVAEFDKVLIPFLTNKMNHRNHRKIVVVDGLFAITGGINIGDEYIHRSKKFGFWRDTSILVEGEVVRDFSVLFSGDWFFATGERLEKEEYYQYHSTEEEGGVQIIDSGPHSPLACIKQSYFRMIMGAEKSVYVITPYLIPDFDIISALKNAALSGIDVRIIVPGRADKKFVYYATQSYFETLLEAGVRIFTYDNIFCHSKVIIVDEDIASIGTANMDIRSFYLNFEVNVMLYQTESIQGLLNDFNIDFSRSTEVIYSQWKNRPILRRATESLVQLFSSIL